MEYREIFSNETNAEQFLKLYQIIGCEELYTPLIVVYIGGKPKALVIGFVGERAYWTAVVEEAARAKGLLVVKWTGEAIVLGEDAVKTVANIVGKLAIVPPSSQEGGTRERPANATSEVRTEELTLSKALPVVVGAALADSVNPCTFSVFTALLLIVMAMRGVRRAWLCGAAFIGAVYVAYFALGLGLIEAFGYVPWIKYVVAALGLGLGSMAILGGLESRARGKFKSPVPARLRKITETAIERAVNPLTAALAGLVVSVTLLPCSSGPYLIAAAVLAKLKPQAFRLPLLALYNAIFVLPLVAILVATLLAAIKLRKIKEWRSKKLPVLEVMSGALLILISVYALLALP